MKTLEERFLRKVNKSSGMFASDGTECWEWIGSKNRSGYGSIRIDNKLQVAHRVSWQLYCTDPINDFLVLHSCDHTTCVRPSHLFLGTHEDNMADMKSKGRATGGAPRGEDNGNSKLDQYAIIDIRDLFSKGWSKSAIARRFGVTPRTIRQIVNHETWQMV